MAEKSPRVQPTRHRNVLTPARFHVGRDAQKSQDNTGGGVGFFVLLQQDGLLALWEDVDLEKATCRKVVARVVGHGLRRSGPARRRRTEGVMGGNNARPRREIMPVIRGEIAMDVSTAMLPTAFSEVSGEPQHQVQ